ncbi:MAG: hypothetical protein JJU27_12375 [Gammaproteobacteria bacterium]|nr:hypothetical protein [Gammaproteobacteria bacterium]
MLQGWPLFFVCGAATVATIVMARWQPLAWFALGALFFVLRLPELGVAAWVGGVVVLVYRVSNPRPEAGDDELR